MSEWNVCPKQPPITLDRSSHLAWLALSGYSKLAADTILNKEIRGKLCNILGDAIRQLSLKFVQDPGCRERCFEVLVEVGLNLIGIERLRVGFSDEEAKEALRIVVEALKWWESVDRGRGRVRGPYQERKPEHERGISNAAMAVVKRLLGDMKKVLLGNSMVARLAEEIEKGLDEENLMASFMVSAQKAIRENIYYRIVSDGISKLGNDSATGLRWVRHLGAVQVSSNPVIAARAFRENPELWKRFKELSKAHPEWSEDPERFEDEIAIYGTIVSLLPNLLDFRPIALLSNFHDGLVSLQLNPFKASSLEGSLGDALKIYGILQGILKEYDAHLMPNTEIEGRGRPNVVFKVAGSDMEAIRITEALNSLGMGTNDTVTYTVSQEVALTFAAMRGLAKAVKVGIPITQVYITNMEGRLEDHLREVEAERLLKAALEKVADRDAYIMRLAEGLGALEEVSKASSHAEGISILCSKRYLRSLMDPRFKEALRGMNMDEKALSRLEEDIRLSGVFVTRRVFKLAFQPENRPKWERWLQETLGLSEAEAHEVLDKVDLLPSSKRRAEDTLLVLAGRGIENVTNTEFPDQQLRVWEFSRQEGFELTQFENSIGAQPDDAALKRLLSIGDFRKAYELTTELSERLRKIGIEAPLEDGGLKPEEWSRYGPAAKTMREFGDAYLNFRRELVGFLKAV